MRPPLRELRDERQIPRRTSARHPRLPRRAGVRPRRTADPRLGARPRMGISAEGRARNRCRPRRALRRDLRQHGARAGGRGGARRLPVARRRAARRRLRLGRRSGDDAGRRAGHQHAELDAAAGRDDRADFPAGARRQAVPQGPADPQRPLARADGQHGSGAHRTHAGRDRRRTHRPGAAAHGAHVRSEAARDRSACRCDRARLPRCAQSRAAGAAAAVRLRRRLLPARTGYAPSDRCGGPARDAAGQPI